MSGDCSSVAPNYSNPMCCGVGHGMDEYGRPLPNPVKYPSAGPNGALGFKPIIDKVRRSRNALSQQQSCFLLHRHHHTAHCTPTQVLPISLTFSTSHDCIDRSSIACHWVIFLFLSSSPLFKAQLTLETKIFTLHRELRFYIKVHAMGLRFQLRMERGISIEAVQQKTKVFGTNYTADEIVDWNRSCGKVTTHHN